ncbi:MAG: YHS domain-containing (seleno)protein [Pseudomonadota bacterium]
MLILPVVATAQMSEIRTTAVGNFAMGGFDPVSYFDANEPAKGSEAFSYFWKGARWLFTSQANLEAFRAEPEAFAPAYGGHGAWPVTVGQYVYGDPRIFTITDGRLFLHYTEATRDQWRAEQERLTAQADRNWAADLEQMR